MLAFVQESVRSELLDCGHFLLEKEFGGGRGHHQTYNSEMPAILPAIQMQGYRLGNAN